MQFVNKIMEIVIGFFVLGILMNAFLFPMASQWSGMVFQNATGFYLDDPAAVADIPINYGVYVIYSNMLLFINLIIVLIVIGVVMAYMKFGKK